MEPHPFDPNRIERTTCSTQEADCQRHALNAQHTLQPLKVTGISLPLCKGRVVEIVRPFYPIVKVEADVSTELIKYLYRASASTVIIIDISQIIRYCCSLLYLPEHFSTVWSKIS